MPLGLGIDTGGTYTDAALVEMDTGRVLHSAKSLTTYSRLSKGITRALDEVLAKAGGGALGDVGLVGLSTTLATNAIVEARHGRAGLVLIGYDQDLIQRYDLGRRLVVENVTFISGGHDVKGEQAAPLDMEALARLADDCGGLESFGVSSFFSVRNPEHELKARDYLMKATGLPVTCGHELSQNLDSITRATTTALNATLIPILTELIAEVRLSLKDRRVGGRLMVVKGDGSLVDADQAVKRPVETILSGPAASVVGATHLAGLRQKADKMWVVDIGGTTTDIAFLEDGLPAVATDGARVGGWRTMVQAVEVRTVGLGGDSQVRPLRGGGFELGPRRVTPLCRLGDEFSGVAAELERQKRARVFGETAGIFFWTPANGPNGREGLEPELKERLESGPASWAALASQGGPAAYLPIMVHKYVSRRLFSLAGFTPTDALHALGMMDAWDAEASLAGADLLAAGLGLGRDEFCSLVLERFHQSLGRELALSALAREGLKVDGLNETISTWLMEGALEGDTPGRRLLSCALTLEDPLVAVGAPVGTYAPPVAKRLGTELVIPPMAEVANAVGAVVGGVVLRRRALIKPDQEFGSFRLHLPGEMKVFKSKEDAVSEARAVMASELRKEALRSGSREPDLKEERIEQVAKAGRRGDDDLYLGTELIYTAVGRPSLG